MNLERHRSTKFVLKQDLAKHTRLPLCERDVKLECEYDIPIHEVTKKKKKITDSIMVHLSWDTKISKFCLKITYKLH